MEFKTYKLQECVDLKTGYAFKSKLFNQEGKGIKLVRGKNITTGSLRWGDDTRFWNGSTTELSKYFLEENDIVIGMDGSKVGQNYAAVSKSDLPLLLVQRVARLRAKEFLDQKFLYYLIDNKNFLGYVNNVKTGTSIPHISGNQIMNYEVSIPSIETQKKIVEIINPIDQKIQLNKEMVANLEKMAQVIFRRWFIDYEFSNEMGEPYKSSGSKMVESEIGEIPYGWKTSSLYDLAVHVNGTSFKNKDFDSVGFPVIKIAELKSGITSQTKFYSKNDKSQKYYINDKDILFSWSGNPETSIDTFIWTKNKAILNQHIFKIEPKEQISSAYLYFLYKYMKPVFTRIASDKQTTGLGHVTLSDLKRLKIAYPGCTTFESFNNVLEPMFESIFNKLQENEKLIVLRNTLLPKLLSGDIDLFNEIEVTEHVPVP